VDLRAPMTPAQQRAERIVFWCSLTYFISQFWIYAIPVFASPLIVIAAMKLRPLAKAWREGGLRPTARLRVAATLTAIGLLWFIVLGVALVVQLVWALFTDGYWRY
jgi:hypothetical protein